MNQTRYLLLLGSVLLIVCSCGDRTYKTPTKNNDTVSQNAPLKCEVVKETVTPYGENDEDMPSLQSGPEGYLEYSNFFLGGSSPELSLVNKEGEKTTSLGTYNLTQVRATPAPGGFYLYHQDYVDEHRIMEREVVYQNGQRSEVEDLSSAILPNLGDAESWHVGMAGMNEDGSKIIFRSSYASSVEEANENGTKEMLWLVEYDQNGRPINTEVIADLNPDQDYLWTTFGDMPGYGVITDDENVGIDFNYHQRDGSDWLETKTYIALPDADEWSWEEYIKVINWQNQPALLHVQSAAREPNYYSVIENAILTRINPLNPDAPYQIMKLPPVMDVEALGDVLVGITTDEDGNPKDVVLIEEEGFEFQAIELLGDGVEL